MQPTSYGSYTRQDFSTSPLLVFYEVTQACDLACQHCRACAQPRADPEELNTQQARQLIEQLCEFPRPPLLVLTGGDPLKRSDIFELIRMAVSRRLKVAMTPSATPLATPDAIEALQQAGVGRLAVSLDGPDAASHDAMRGVPGSFDLTLRMLQTARSIDLPAQVNTTITRRNCNQIDEMAELIAGYGIVLWSVFFLVPVGRAAAERRISPRQYERVFARLYNQSRRRPFSIKTTEAPHYRRYVLQRRGDPQRGGAMFSSSRQAKRAPLGVNDGRGVMFVSHTGKVYPSGFMAIECGQFPRDSVVDVYQNHPLFTDLRQPARLHGKCGVCEYNQVCGGSRARAYAVTGEPLAEEPDCVYVPANWDVGRTSAAPATGSSGTLHNRANAYSVP